MFLSALNKYVMSLWQTTLSSKPLTKLDFLPRVCKTNSCLDHHQSRNNVVMWKLVTMVSDATFGGGGDRWFFNVVGCSCNKVPHALSRVITHTPAHSISCSRPTLTGLLDEIPKLRHECRLERRTGSHVYLVLKHGHLVTQTSNKCWK